MRSINPPVVSYGSSTYQPAISSLDRPVQFLKGVGPGRAPLLQKLGLLTARDVLYHAPHRYEDASTITHIGALATGMDATIIGRVVSAGVLPTRKGLRIFQAVIRDDTGMIECAWPGQPYLERVIHKGDLLLLSGPVKFFHGRQMQPREFTVVAGEGETPGDDGAGFIFPVYPATEGLTYRQLRKLIHDNLDELLRRVREEEDAIPADVLKRIEVEPLWKALDHVHRPTSLAEAEQGRRRLAFEELFYLQLLHARTRHRTVAERAGIAFQRKDFLVKPFHRQLPFTLTNAQKKVLKEIGEDMASPKRMNRLLQGDVGSGKTVVALFAMLRAVENGYQAALMVPTEILAEQHARTLQRLLADLPVSITLLTGRLGTKQWKEVSYRIASGDADIVVGTHALIQEGVQFHNLGLVVVDEQHRFGVKQRLTIQDMSQNGDTLVMSATPIPRSLALTLYGDLDISVLDERPPGRRPIKTALRMESSRPRVFKFVEEEVRKGRQAYIVYPLVEESEKVDLKAAAAEFEQLQGLFPHLRMALIHGQMPGEEKDRTMRAFGAGEVDVLVSTTVIEVGIDVPNATVMVIEHAERFGLSQLHQLRGRVGRGSEDSFCILIFGGQGSLERLKVFASTEDGFAIAEADLRLRGAGDLFGARQSGLPAFRFADLEKDLNLLSAARGEARAIVERDPELANHPQLRDALSTRYEERARMFRVG
ncbi:ATP-dependent DNA helicase RecG [Longimicrobium sp.]|uniref:ATP-dependent DNA helicase RecG n=1 Tax=Longimicrobium sp. TaxID=2029185 RepID=UPI002C94761B|nr:ATP-dependent DNA helicase RecG [Longimicrobium sp.]HSU15281.1 ATP-dependent DNA helicase RecG [Longimicrobium sp.]